MSKIFEEVCFGGIALADSREHETFVIPKKHLKSASGYECEQAEESSNKCIGLVLAGCPVL